MKTNLYFIGTESTILSGPQVKRSIRDQIVKRMIQLDLLLKGKEDSMDEYIDTSKEKITFPFNYLGLDVTIHFFLDLNRGVIIVDEYVFEDFPLKNNDLNNWEMLLMEILHNFISTGAFIHLSDAKIEDFENKGFNVEKGDLIIRFLPTHLMRERDIVIGIEKIPVLLSSTRHENWTGFFPVIIKRIGIENMQSHGRLMDHETLVKIFFDIYHRKMMNEEKDLHAIDSDDYMNEIIEKK